MVSIQQILILYKLIIISRRWDYEKAGFMYMQTLFSQVLRLHYNIENYPKILIKLMKFRISIIGVNFNIKFSILHT